MIYGASGDGLAGDEVALDWFDRDNNRGRLTEGHYIVLRDSGDLKNGVTRVAGLSDDDINCQCRYHSAL